MEYTARWRVSQPWLHLPVRTGAPKVAVRLSADSGWMTHFEIELGSETECDFLAPYNLSGLVGREVSVVWSGPEPKAARLPELVRWSDRPEGFDGAYCEPLRPLFHFTARRGWLNDPNGCVFYDGQYHLFFQHNPWGVEWGNMHWGHAVSPDLVHWRETDGEALCPDSSGTMFSGSAVVDWKNTSGLGRNGCPPLVLFYTAWGELAPAKVPITQGLAFSTDGGRTFRKYDRNPIVPHLENGNRDPKVIWHEASNSWIMVLYLGEAGGRFNNGLLSRTPQKFAILRSSNLQKWDIASQIIIPCNGECPDLFPLHLDGDPGQERWVFWTADGQYLIGRFDGWRFQPELEPVELYMGGRERASGYAAQTFSDTPDGRRIQIPWLQASSFPGMPFNQQMGFPVELSLRTTDVGPRLCAVPVREIERLIGSRRMWQDVPLDSAIFHDITGDAMRIRVRLHLESRSVVHWMFHGRQLVLDAESGEIRFGTWTAPGAVRPGTQELEILVDRASLELFGREGLLYMPLYGLRRRDGIEVQVSGVARVEHMELAEIAPIWRE